MASHNSLQPQKRCSAAQEWALLMQVSCQGQHTTQLYANILKQYICLSHIIIVTKIHSTFCSLDYILPVLESHVTE